MRHLSDRIGCSIGSNIWGCTGLVAEDNQTNQIVIGRMLSKLGLRYHFVANGNEAIDALREQQFDLILMDCQMPVMDGYDATRAIRSGTELPRNIPIVALTAHAVQGEEKKCLDAGMNAYITKPINSTTLRTVLAKFLSQK